MTFLAAGFLFVLFLAALPLVIHWLARRRREVAWAAMAILAQVMASTRRKAQIREIIILSLRVLAVALAIFAFARPAKPGGGDTQAGLVAVIIDASGSMQYRIGAESRLDRAKNLAKAAVMALPPDARVALVVAPALTVDGKVAAVAGEPTNDRVAITAAIDRVVAGNAAFDPAIALTAAGRSLKAGIGSRAIILVSDLQAGDWSAQAQSGISQSLSALNALDPRPALRIIDAGDHELADVAVESVTVDDPLPTAGAAIPVRAVLRARGGAAPSPLAVDLYLATDQDPALRKVDSRVIARLDGTVTVEFSAKLPAGNVALEVRCQADRLAATDRGRVVVEVVERVEVLVVDGKGAVAGFTGAAPFLAAALSPAGELSSFATTRMTPIQLSPSRLNTARVVALADVSDLSAPVAEALTAWVRRGGVLLAFMGDDIQPTAWNRLFAELLPVRLDQPLDLGANGSALEPVAAHPLLQPFVADEFAPLLTRPRTRKLMGATLVAGDGTAQSALVATIAGKPAIVTHSVGRGRVWWYGMSADRSWSDLCLHPAFVPLVQRAVQLGIAGTAPRTVPAGQVASLDAGADRIGAQATVTAPDGNTAMRTWEALPGGDRTCLDIPGTLLAGIYRIANTGNTTDGNRLLAVDTPASEGDLTALAPADLARQLPGLDVAAAGASAIAHAEIGWWLLVLALLCLAAETALAALWAPQDEEAEAVPSASIPSP